MSALAVIGICTAFGSFVVMSMGMFQASPTGPCAMLGGGLGFVFSLALIYTAGLP